MPWLGFSGVKAKFLWNNASREQRDLMLAAVGIIDGSYHDDLLAKQWGDLPGLVQISLSDTLKEIRNSS